MLLYSEVFHVLLYGCWPNLTKMWIPLAEESKILFSGIFYILKNRTIHTLIQVSHLIHTINLSVDIVGCPLYAIISKGLFDFFLFMLQ